MFETKGGFGKANPYLKLLPSPQPPSNEPKCEPEEVRIGRMIREHLKVQVIPGHSRVGVKLLWDGKEFSTDSSYIDTSPMVFGR